MRGPEPSASSRLQTGDNGSWDTGFTGGAGVRWTFEVSEIFLDLNHGLDPSSAGEYVTSDQPGRMDATDHADGEHHARRACDQGDAGRK
jgi:hypothetical protein